MTLNEPMGLAAGGSTFSPATRTEPPLSLASLSEEQKMKPLQTGLALSMTVALFYSLCTLVEVVWPAQFMDFMNALFHGMDFRALQTAALHPWRDYFYALVVMALWAFAIGAFFAFLHNALERLHWHRPVRHA
jgi:ABC-type phosphate/phosphonate transport system permease subunit